ncbi:hypothetical protein [Fibrella arboris]|uniref:hypothetical protein n=1 Tax=Fibrella arboris TaxID=3242486 RepID=UPI00352055AB
MALRTSTLIALGMLLGISSQAQDTIPLYSDVIAKQKAVLRPSVGVDLYQGVWALSSALRHDSPATYTYPVSVTLYFPDKNRFERPQSLFINAGYVAYHGVSQRTIYQKGNSLHIRVGIEQLRHRLIRGYSVLLSGWSGAGSFLFRGSTFGDHQESIGTISGLAMAAEGHLGVAAPVSERLSFRAIMRGSILYQPTTAPYGLYAPHLSGIDWQSETKPGIGLSLQANLVYRL